MAWAAAVAVVAMQVAGGVAGKIAANKQAQALKDQGEEAYRQVQKEGAQLLGRQQAVMGASGFDSGSVTYEALRMADAEEVENAALTKRYEYLSAASAAKARGNLALIGGLTSGAASGASSYMGMSGGYGGSSALSGTRLSGQFSSYSGSPYGGASAARASGYPGTP